MLAERSNSGALAGCAGCDLDTATTAVMPPLLHVRYLLQVCLLVSLCENCCAPACMSYMIDDAVCLLACLLTSRGVYTNCRDKPQLCEGCHTAGTKYSCSSSHLTLAAMQPVSLHCEL